MKLLYIAIFLDLEISRSDDNEYKPKHEYSIFSKGLLSNVIHKHSIQLFRFVSITVLMQLLKVNKNLISIQDGKFLLHCLSSEHVSYVVLTDMEYPEVVARRLLYLLSKQFAATQSRLESPVEDIDLAILFNEYQNPNTDPLYRLQVEVEETKAVIHSNIEKLFERGERLEDIIAKTDYLENTTKTFYKRAKSSNRWCPFWFNFNIF